MKTYSEDCFMCGGQDCLVVSEECCECSNCGWTDRPQPEPQPIEEEED